MNTEFSTYIFYKEGTNETCIGSYYSSAEGETFGGHDRFSRQTTAYIGIDLQKHR